MHSCIMGHPACSGKCGRVSACISNWHMLMVCVWLVRLIMFAGRRLHPVALCIRQWRVLLPVCIRGSAGLRSCCVDRVVVNHVFFRWPSTAPCIESTLMVRCRRCVREAAGLLRQRLGAGGSQVASGASVVARRTISMAASATFSTSIACRQCQSCAITRCRVLARASFASMQGVPACSRHHRAALSRRLLVQRAV